MKNINKILYLVGVFSIVNILIWLYKNNILYKEKTKEIMNNNFITNYKELTSCLKDTINKIGRL